MEMARQVQSIQNWKLVIFLQYIQEKALQQLIHFMGIQSSHICCYLFLGGCGPVYIYIYIYIERERERDDFLRDDKYIYTYIICMLTDANLGKLNVNLIIIGWVCSKMTETF